jgi:hypothetical protein
MNETDTDCQEKRTVSEWAQRKGTKRWLLCLAATGAGWLPEQEDDAQDEVTEAEYDAAVEAARSGNEKAKEKAGGHDRVKALLFTDRLLGVVVKRLRPTEAGVFNKQLENAPEGEAAAVSANAFEGAVLWPEPKALNLARERVPNAFKATFPLMFVRLVGMDGGDRVKKR